MQNSYNINSLRAATYKYGAKFDNITLFFRHVKNDFVGIQNPAEKALLKNELEKLLSYLNNDSFPETSYGNHNTLDRYNLIFELISKTFDDIKLPDLYIVDKDLNGVGQNKQWDALTLDKLDEKRTGYKKGIYFKEASINQPYFDFTVIHELIHWIISEYSQKYFPYATIIEEGLCDYLSYYFLLKENLLDAKTVTNLIAYLRVLKPQNSNWSYYYRFSKLISAFAISQGIDKLFAIIRGGRSAVNTIRQNDIAFQFVSDQVVDTVSLCFNDAETFVVLGVNDFIAWERIFRNGKNVFNEKDLSCDELTSVELDLSLKNLYDLNLINSNGELYFQNLVSFPSNIKFKVSE